MFDWNDLRFFLEVARARSLSAAARKLGVNHTTVARRVQSLEGSLRTRLFEKTPSGYLLTSTGTDLLKQAEKIESANLAVAESVGGQNAVLTGNVRLGVPEGFGTQFIAPRLKDFYRRYPGIDLELVAGPQFLSISKREVDLAVTLSRPQVGRLIARKLTDYALKLYATRDYLKRHAPIRDVEDLRGHTLIGYIDDLIYAPQLRYLDEILPDARVKLRSSSINAQVAAAESGLGLSVLHCFGASQRKALQVVLREQIAVKRSFWLSMHQDLRHIRRVNAVWEWMLETVAQNQKLLLGG